MSVDYGFITDSTTVVTTGGAQPDTSKPFRNIRAAFENQFNTMLGQASITIGVFENVEKDLSEISKDAQTTEWCRGTLIPSVTRGRNLGGVSVATEEHNGIFQIDYYNRVGVGGYTDKLDSIANQFRRGLQLSHAGTVVHLTSVSLGVGRREDAFFVRNVDVSYFAVTPARS